MVPSGANSKERTISIKFIFISVGASTSWWTPSRSMIFILMSFIKLSMSRLVYELMFNRLILQLLSALLFCCRQNLQHHQRLYISSRIFSLEKYVEKRFGTLMLLRGNHKESTSIFRDRYLRRRLHKCPECWFGNQGNCSPLLRSFQFRGPNLQLGQALATIRKAE